MAWQLLKLLGLDSQRAPQEAGTKWTTADNVIFGESWAQSAPGYTVSTTVTVSTGFERVCGLVAGHDMVMLYGRGPGASNANPFFARRYRSGLNTSLLWSSAALDPGNQTLTSMPGAIVSTDWMVLTAAKVGLSLSNSTADVPVYISNLDSTASVTATYAAWDGTENWSNANSTTNYLRHMTQTRNYGFGVGFKTGATGDDPEAVIYWSDAFANTQPNWDTSITAADTGSSPLSDTGGEIITIRAVTDNRAVIYKRNAAYVANWCGGQFVWDIRLGFTTIGAAGRECVAQVGQEHIVVTNDDVVRTNGFSYQSIARDDVRDDFNADADASDRSRTYVTTLAERQEVWIFLWDGSAYTKAYVWSWRYSTWSTVSGFSVVALAKAQHWNSEEAILSLETHPTGGSTATARPVPVLHMLNGATRNGTTFTAELVRTGLDFGLPGRKLARWVRPRLTGDTGALVEISVGSHELDQLAVTWGSVQTFTCGTTQSLQRSANVAGRYLAVRVRAATASSWKLHDIGLDIQPLGEY